MRSRLGLALALVAGLAVVLALVFTLALGDESPPDLLEHLAVEQLWILLDIAVIGTGLARQRATTQLREAMRDLHRRDGLETPHLQELASMLGTIPSGEMSLLFQTLQLATHRALEQQQPPTRANRA